MRPIDISNSKLIKVAAGLVIATIVIALLILGKSFLIPLAWSLMIALASFQMLNKMEHRFKIKRLVSSLVFVGLLFLIISLLFYFFYSEIALIIKGMPSFSESLIIATQNIINVFDSYGVHIPALDKTQINGWLAGHTHEIVNILASFGQGIGNLFLVGIYLFFILLYRDNYLYFIRLREKTNDGFADAKKRSKEVIGIINNFLHGLFAITLILAVMMYIIFLLIGLKFALFFAVMVALLSLIPYIGSPLGMVIVFVFAAISNDGLLIPVLALAGMIVSNVLKSNVLKPIVIGNKINLNALMIFLSVIIGGMIWGVSGMILFMPFAGIAKVLLENNESTRPFAALFTILPKDAFDKLKTDKTEE